MPLKYLYKLIIFLCCFQTALNCFAQNELKKINFINSQIIKLLTESSSNYSNNNNLNYLLYFKCKSSEHECAYINITKYLHELNIEADKGESYGFNFYVNKRPIDIRSNNLELIDFAENAGHRNELLFNLLIVNSLLEAQLIFEARKLQLPITFMKSLLLDPKNSRLSNTIAYLEKLYCDPNNLKCAYLNYYILKLIEPSVLPIKKFVQNIFSYNSNRKIENISFDGTNKTNLILKMYKLSNLLRNWKSKIICFECELQNIKNKAYTVDLVEIKQLIYEINFWNTNCLDTSKIYLQINELFDLYSLYKSVFKNTKITSSRKINFTTLSNLIKKETLTSITNINKTLSKEEQ